MLAETLIWSYVSVRDKEKREVDFVILKDGRVYALVEAKLSDEKLSSHLAYNAEKLSPIHTIQVVLNLKHEYQVGKARILTLQSMMKAVFDPAEMIQNNARFE